MQGLDPAEHVWAQGRHGGVYQVHQRPPTFMSECPKLFKSLNRRCIHSEMLIKEHATAQPLRQLVGSAIAAHANMQQFPMNPGPTPLNKSFYA